MLPSSASDLTCTYFFNKKSIINADGFPTTMGSFSVEPHKAATIHPAPASPNQRSNMSWDGKFSAVLERALFEN